jgi:Bacterial PH domain
MQVRSGSMPDDPRPDGTPGPVRSWRVSSGTTRLKLAGMAGFAVAALFSLDNPVRLAFAGVAGLALAGYALRDVLVPVRLRADPAGVTVVVGYAGHRRLAWSQIERVRVDQLRRFGLRSEFLEIDAGDGIYLFSPYDLDAPCTDVVAALAELRTGTAAPDDEAA